MTAGGNETGANETGANDKSVAGRNRLRWVVRLISLVACCGVLMVGSATIWPVVVPALSPLVTLSSLLATRTLYWHLAEQ